MRRALCASFRPGFQRHRSHLHHTRARCLPDVLPACGGARKISRRIRRVRQARRRRNQGVLPERAQAHARRDRRAQEQRHCMQPGAGPAERPCAASYRNRPRPERARAGDAACATRTGSPQHNERLHAVAAIGCERHHFPKYYYSIPEDTDSGAGTKSHTLTLTTGVGSTTTPFAVYDPTPSISSISPSTWQRERWAHSRFQA